MGYFKSKENAIKVIRYVKGAYKEEHDNFHSFRMESFGITENIDGLSRLKRLLLMYVQARPILLSKKNVLKIFIQFEDKFKDFDFKESLKSGAEDTIRNMEKKLDDLPYIGPKIANLVLNHFFCFTDTMNRFGIEQPKILRCLKLPVDVHVRRLLCYRLQLVFKEEYKNLETNSPGFQKELKDLLQNESELFPIDLDILWYIGYSNCNLRIFCKECKIRGKCEDRFFENETRNKVADPKRAEEEICFVKKHGDNVY